MSENELGRTLDQCLADSAIKVVAGAAIGIVTSLALFKGRRSWPIWLGTGIGTGMGVNNCQNQLKRESAKPVAKDAAKSDQIR